MYGIIYPNSDNSFDWSATFKAMMTIKVFNRDDYHSKAYCLQPLSGKENTEQGAVEPLMPKPQTSFPPKIKLS